MKQPTRPKCIEMGCDKRPVFNAPGVRRGMYCKPHRLDGMIDVANKTCADKGCLSQPSYNSKDAKTGLYCVKHRLDFMVNVKITRHSHIDRCDYIHCTNKDYCDRSTYRKRASSRLLADWCIKQLST